MVVYSEKLSNIIVSEKCEVYSTIKYSFCLSLNLSQKGHTSIESLQMTSKFELDLYVIMLCPSVKN